MPRVIRDRKTEDAERVDAVKDYIPTNGIQNITLHKLTAHVNASLPHKPTVGIDSVRSILIEQLNLRYGPFNASRYRYEDPNYDEKRVQICRLLAQFHLDGAIIVSVDESNFKASGLTNRRWQTRGVSRKLAKVIEEEENSDMSIESHSIAYEQVSEDLSNLSRERGPKKFIGPRVKRGRRPKATSSQERSETPPRSRTGRRVRS